MHDNCKPTISVIAKWGHGDEADEYQAYTSAHFHCQHPVIPKKPHTLGREEHNGTAHHWIIQYKSKKDTNVVNPNVKAFFQFALRKYI